MPKAPLITLEDLRQRFDRPLAEVASEFGVCLTFIKRLCRTYDIKRWPYRQIQSLHSKAEKLEKLDADGAAMAIKKHILAIQKETGTAPPANALVDHMGNPFYPSAQMQQMEYMQSQMPQFSTSAAAMAYAQQRQIQGMNSLSQHDTNRQPGSEISPSTRYCAEWPFNMLSVSDLVANGSVQGKSQDGKEQMEGMNPHLPSIASMQAGSNGMGMTNKPTGIVGHKQPRDEDDPVGDAKAEGSGAERKTKHCKTGQEAQVTGRDCRFSQASGDRNLQALASLSTSHGDPCGSSMALSGLSGMSGLTGGSDVQSHGDDSLRYSSAPDVGSHASGGQRTEHIRAGSSTSMPANMENASLSLDAKPVAAPFRIFY